MCSISFKFKATFFLVKNSFLACLENSTEWKSGAKGGNLQYLQHSSQESGQQELVLELT